MLITVVVVVATAAAAELKKRFVYLFGAGHKLEEEGEDQLYQ